MSGFSKTIVKKRIAILIASMLLLIPSVIGYIRTKVNYDLLTYLPDEIDTMKGQDILKEDFGTGAFSLLVTQNMQEKEIAELKKQIEEVDHVRDVIWYDSFLDISVPMDLLPEKLYDAFNNGDASMMMVLFDDTSSADGTTEAARINAETETQVAKIYAEAQKANIEFYRFLQNLDTVVNSVNSSTILVVKADEYPFNILTEYSQNMEIEGNETVISDLTYILTQLPETERETLINAIAALIEDAASKNNIDMSAQSKE